MVTRRGFLKSSIFSSAAAALSFKNITSEKNTVNNNKIITRKLGKTGIELPIVSMGVMRSDTENIIKAALKSGIKHFDTAHSYQKGKNEIMLGELLKNYSRDSFIIGTKVLPEDSYVDRKQKELTSISTKKAFLNRFNTSLERLQMDYVDILYVHAIERAQAVKHEPILEALTEAKKSGKARFTGISIHGDIPELIDAIIETGIYDVILTPINFKQKRVLEIKEKIALAAEKGIGIIGMKTMAGAYLDREKTKPINCKAALKWVLQDTNIHTTIPAMTSFDQLIENMSVMEGLTLTNDELNDLKLAELEAGLYCDNCSICLPNCKKNLPINDIMRAYMYAYGYNNTGKAKQLLTDLKIKNNPCADCETCSVQCANNFNVAQKISDIARLNKIPNDFLT